MTVERLLTEEEPAADLVGRVLQEAGIEYVFGISGGHTGRIIQGFRKYQNSLRMVLVREESLAGVMAEVYGRLTRKPGVMIGQGPWVLGNGLIGTLEAYLSSSPMLLLTDFSDATPLHLHAPYQQATGDYGSWDARRAFSGVTQARGASADADRRGAGDAACDQACTVGTVWSRGCAVRHGFARRHFAAGFATGLVSDEILPAGASAAGRCRVRGCRGEGTVGGGEAGGDRGQRRAHRRGL
jgi:thiamine pyrophosphate-dependent enzyme